MSDYIDDLEAGNVYMNYTELEATLTELDKAPLPPSMQLAIAQVRLLIDLAEVQKRQEALLERLLMAWKGERKVGMKKKDAKGDAVIKAKPATKKCPTCKKSYAGKECPHCKKLGMGGKAAESAWR